MRLDHWVTRQLNEAKDRGEHKTRRNIVEGLAQSAGVSYVTLSSVERGARLSAYEKARVVSEATGWAVTIPELCGDPALDDPKVRDQFQALLKAMVGDDNG